MRQFITYYCKVVVLSLLQVRVNRCFVIRCFVRAVFNVNRVRRRRAAESSRSLASTVSEEVELRRVSFR